MNILIRRFIMSHLRLYYSPAQSPLLPPSAISFLKHRRQCRRSRLFTTFQCSASTKSKKQKVIVISGPTGAGKSRLALELSKKLNGEIISADSVQVYQGLDVGSAKSSASERQEVPHHLVDILHPTEDYSAGNFYDDGRQATKDILNRGCVPIVTGGTGLYLRWFIYGKPDVPKATPEISLEVQSELASFERSYDWDAAVQLVTKAGDPTAQSLPANDWYRLRRKLEIIKSSGLPPSAFPIPYDSFKGQKGQLTSGVKVWFQVLLPFVVANGNLNMFLPILQRFLKSMLHKMIMTFYPKQDGFLMWVFSQTQILPHVQSVTDRLWNTGGRSSERDFYTFLSGFQKASRNFAKRQLTWFRNEPIYHWIDASRPLIEVFDFIYNAYHDQTGKLVVPRSLAMHKDMSDRRKISQLKTYQTKRGVFISQADCSDVLDWISNNQRRKTELIAN